MQQKLEIEKLTEVFSAHSLLNFLDEDEQSDILIKIQNEEITTPEDLELELSHTKYARKAKGKQKLVIETDLFTKLSQDHRSQLLSDKQKDELVAAIREARITNQNELQNGIEMFLRFEEDNIEDLTLQSSIDSFQVVPVHPMIQLLKYFEINYPLEILAPEMTRQILMDINNEVITTIEQLEIKFRHALEQTTANADVEDMLPVETLYDLITSDNRFALLDDQKQAEFIMGIQKREITSIDALTNMFSDVQMNINLMTNSKQEEAQENTTTSELEEEINNVLENLIETQNLKNIRDLPNLLQVIERTCHTCNLDQLKQSIYTLHGHLKYREWLESKLKTVYPGMDEEAFIQKIQEVSMRSSNPNTMFRYSDVEHAAKALVLLNDFRDELEQKKDLIDAFYNARKTEEEQNRPSIVFY